LEKNVGIRYQVHRIFGTHNRHELRKIVFANDVQRSRLEQILHPAILHEVRLRVDQLKNRKPKPPAVIIMIPLLFETEAQAQFDEIISVVCRTDTQMRRLVERDGITSELAQKMMASQFTNAEKAQRSTHAIWNDGNKASLFQKVDELSKKLIGSAVS
jgi:dephospho-CoA kinase